MNKKILVSVIIILMFVLIGALGTGLMISQRISNAGKGEYLWSAEESALYHVMVIIDDSVSTYNDEFESGLMEIAEEKHIAVEIIAIEGRNYGNNVIEALEKARFSKVDGVILHAFENEDVIKEIEQLSEIGIPVFTMNADLPDSKRTSYVGVDQYRVGLVAGESLIEHMGDTGRVAIIQQKNYSSEDMLILGFKDVLIEYPNVTVEYIENTEQGVLSAETVVADILKNNNSIDGIFCTDGQNTLGAIQVLLDKNLINDVVLIGYGNDDEIYEYIKKGNIIEAAIVLDDKDLGYKTLNAFYEYKSQSYVANYINTKASVVDKTIVDVYLREKGDLDD